MAGANDNDKARRVRDGYLTHWSHTNFSEVASDEALCRLAEARNESANSANKFMLFAAAGALLYALRLEGLASELAIAEYSLGSLPFGQFVLASITTTLSTIALIRTGDSRAYDRQLRLACEERYPSDCELRYVVFPNQKAWGEPFSKMANVIKAGWPMSLLRLIGLILVNLFLLALVLSPLAVGLDYLVGGRYQLEEDHESFRFWAVCFLTTSNSLIFILVFWSRISDRD